MYSVGLDAGSMTIKVVVLDECGKKIEGHYIRHYGHPIPVALELLKEIERRYPGSSLSVTGSNGKVIASALGIKPVNEIVSQAYAVKRLYPAIRTLIELGGEDSKLIILDDGRIKDFAMNSVCAAGTGSFLEQQAERLRLTIEEFSAMAVRSVRPSKIAGRCSVFAKSDMIHLQQIATPVEDIVGGLCFAVARNFKGTIAKGTDLVPPVAFQGGVAANAGMVRAFREVFDLEELFVPPDFALMGAIGAALKDLDEGRRTALDTGAIESYVSAVRFEDAGQQPLLAEDDDFFDRHERPERQGRHAGDGKGRGKRAYLGIDIGSISTNLAVMDEEGTLLAKRYLMTAGRPIEAVKQGLREIAGEIGETVEIAGVGTTGSGRYMIADYVGADVVKNEITAQATAAISIDPSVDTIFEIGGQDSKYISLRDGIIVDFEMNKACAAGTGSFLEEQAEKLQISVKGEFADLAFSSRKPCRLGERCTVFMENSLMANLQRGADKRDLLAGLAYSIVQNYINRVVAGKTVGNRIFFQGGVAFNKAVVAAFEKYLGAHITVPPNHDVTGAIGMAIIARESMSGRSGRRTMFKGFDLSERSHEISSFECKGCPNVCEINRVKVEGDDGFLFYGGRCEKYDVRKAQQSDLPDLFSFREEMLWKRHLADQEARPEGTAKPLGVIGVPYIFFMHDFLPFWSAFLSELGFEVVVSPKTNKQIVNLGLENVLSEACFPVKVAHGHIQYLKERGITRLFIPSFININQNGDEYRRGVACPYTQTIPYLSKIAINGLDIISPVVDLSGGTSALKRELKGALGRFGAGMQAVEKALAVAGAAQEEFRKAIREKGREILRTAGQEGDEPVIVIIGRAYNAFDSGVNLEIPKKLSHIRVLSVPMDFLPLEEEKLEALWPGMYWRSGQRILKAARIVRANPNLYAIYIGNFSCGPDSFILKYFKEEMEGKPFLHIEIDEHSADAGAITRCEAFLDSIDQQMRHGGRQEEDEDREFRSVRILKCSSSVNIYRTGSNRKRTMFITKMTDHVHAVKAAFEYCGISAEILPESTKESVDLGRKYVSGKECYPYVITAGDMLMKALSDDFRPEESAFFMPSGSGPCRFGQYNISQRLILSKAGLDDVPIFAPNQDETFYRELGVVSRDFYKRSWQGVVACDLLIKCLHETRPYELRAGEADALYAEYLLKIEGAVRGKKDDIRMLLRRIREDFAALPRTPEKRPSVGIVGEIFVRSHTFANEHIVRQVEALGGEVKLAPIDEWIKYLNAVSLRKALIKRDRSAIINLFIKEIVQKRIEHKFGKTFRGFLETLEEPTIREIMAKASPYVPGTFEGETVLSIGKAIDLIERGASGIINVMPFGCMPGTIVTAFMKALTRDFGVTCISIPYDGTESPTTRLQIEAFMEAVKMQRNGKDV